MVRGLNVTVAALAAVALTACNGSSSSRSDVGTASVRVQFSAPYTPGASFTMTLRAFHGGDQTWSSSGAFHDQAIAASGGTWSHDFESLATGDYTFCAQGLDGALEITPACVNATVAKDQATDVAIALHPPTVVVFSTMPDVPPPHLPSQPFQAQQTAEFGDEIALAPGTGRHPVQATVVLVTWSTQAYSHPITLNLYSVSGGALTSIAARTQTFDMPARPAGDPSCPDTGYGAGFAWRASNGTCYNGLAFEITFDLSGLDVMLPDAFAYGVAYDTQTWGYSPLGEDGPYNSLNVGLIGDSSTSSSTQPSVGSDPDPDALLRNFWSFSASPAYTGLVPETDWTGYAPAVEFLAY